MSTPFAVLGREDQSDLLLDSPDVSRRHAYLQLLGGRLWCFDLLSRTGCWWGERRQEIGYFDADGVRIGPYQIRALDPEYLTSARDTADGLVANPLTALPADEDPLPTITLEFPNAHTAGSDRQTPTWQLDRPLTLVGHSHHCKVRFKCSSVSRLHCSLLRTPHGIWVVDLLGRERVLVNGMQVRWAKLNDGDRLKVGRFDIKVRAEAKRSASSSKSAVLMAAPAPGAASEPAGAGSASPPAPPLASETGALMPPLAPPSSLQPVFSGMQGLSQPLDPSHALLFTFMNQFSCMQQQMFDQFQQTTMMMLQMFGNLQRDQFELVRQELDGLRDLNLQIHALQTELEKQRAAPPAVAAAPKPKAAIQAPEVGAAPKPVLSTPASVKPAPVWPAPTPQPPPAAKPQPTASASDKPPATPVPETIAGQTVPAGEDVHDWLAQRFTELQNERQSRWQKLFGTLMGKN